MSTAPAQDQEPASRGRPTTYDPRYVEEARKLCALGAVDAEIAEFFGVHISTLYRWKNIYPEFCDAIKIGGSPADDRVERSLYQQAAGYFVTEQEVVKIRTAKDVEEVRVVDVQRFVPPTPLSTIFWLRNRRKDTWRDVRQIEASGPGGGPLQSEHKVTFQIVDGRDELKALAQTIEGQAVKTPPAE